MKKLLMCLFISVVGLHSTSVLAKSKKRVRHKVNYNYLSYEGVWFSQLSENQQMRYLKTIKKLVIEINRKSVSGLDDSFLKMFIEKANAANRINNGWIFDGSNDASDFDSFLGSLNVLGGPLDPGCRAPEQVSAPYLGMNCSGGQGKLVCSNDSTPTAAQRGSLDCLRSTLAGCGLSYNNEAVSGVATTAYCRDLDRLMKRGIDGVRAHCTAGNRSSFNYCRQAVARLEGSEVPQAPVEKPDPTGADCEQMIREMASTRDQRSAGKNVNNKFWRNITGFAQQACGSTVSGAMNVYGTCDISNSAMMGGGLNRSVVKTRVRPSKGDSNYESKQAAFDQCVQAKIKDVDAAQAERLQEFASQLAKRDLSREERQALKKKQKDAIAVFKRRRQAVKASAQASGECTRSEKESLTDGQGNAVSKELELSTLMSLAGKIRSNTDLTAAEENQMMAGTGMSSAQFRTAFCQSTTHTAFKKQLNFSLRQSPRVNGVDSVANLHLGQARVAHQKMRRCFGSLKPVSGDDGSGCRLYEVKDFNSLRCASKSRPMIAVNRSNKSCMLVTGFNRKTTSREEVRTFGGTETRQTANQATLNIRTAGSGNVVAKDSTMPIRSESFFTKEYQLQEYRCDGDRDISQSQPGRTRCWMKPSSEDPSRAGEAEAREIEL